MRNDLPGYLFIGRASDIKSRKDRLLYRVLEILPGFFIWSTFAAFIGLAYFKPLWIAIFTLAFAFFWLLKVVYLAVHTRTAYKKMRRHEQINWIEKLKALPREDYNVPVNDWRDIWQLAIFPMYKESYEIIASTFDAVLDTDWPKDKMIIVLATEEAGGEEAARTAERIKKEYGSRFGDFLVTSHPKNLEGEIPGKGSNETWAAREAQ